MTRLTSRHVAAVAHVTAVAHVAAVTHVTAVAHVAVVAAHVAVVNAHVVAGSHPRRAPGPRKIVIRELTNDILVVLAVELPVDSAAFAGFAVEAAAGNGNAGPAMAVVLVSALDSDNVAELDVDGSSTHSGLEVQLSIPQDPPVTVNTRVYAEHDAVPCPGESGSITGHALAGIFRIRQHKGVADSARITRGVGVDRKSPLAEPGAVPVRIRVGGERPLRGVILNHGDAVAYAKRFDTPREARNLLFQCNLSRRYRRRERCRVVFRGATAETAGKRDRERPDQTEHRPISVPIHLNLLRTPIACADLSLHTFEHNTA